jgi:hypothetical protein
MTRRRGPASQGYCNICLSYGKLTWDHVPPRGTVGLGPVEIRNFARWLNDAAPDLGGRVRNAGPAPIDKGKFAVRKSANGLKFRSICANCNNSLLGGRFDPELKRVSQAMSNLARAHFRIGLTLPSRMEVTVRTHRLMRAIIGHLLAADAPRRTKENDDANGVGHYDQLRRYFLDEGSTLPGNFRIYYWLYPADAQVVIPTLALWKGKGESWSFGGLLKFFPMAYYLTNSDFGSMSFPTNVVYSDGCADPDCEISLGIDLDRIPPVTWPETPDPHHSIMLPLENSFFVNKHARALPSSSD